MTHDPLPFADFLVARLLRDLPEHGESHRAFSETEHPVDGDDWFWTDDNAKIVELMSLPQVWRRHPQAMSDAIDFLIGMCEGPLIFRRLATPRFEILSSADGRATFRHSLLDIACDLSRGRVSLGMRFHDGRTARNVTFGGDYVRFTHRSRRYTAAVESGIREFGIQPTEGGVRLSWNSEIVFKPNRLGAGPTSLGSLACSCMISSRSMFVDFEATLDIAPGIEASDVTLTFACDDLSHNENNIRYENAAALSDANEVLKAPDDPGPFHLALAGARYWSISQSSHMAGFAVAVHSLPGDPSRVIGMDGARDQNGALQKLTAEHNFPGPRTGRLTASERKLITSGGFYDETALYAEVLAKAAAAEGGLPTDFSISYDYGAEIYAIACCLSTLKGAESPVSPDQAAALQARLEEVFQRLARAYRGYIIEAAHTDLGALFSRSLAYVALAHAEMLKQGDPDGRHARNLRESCDWIIAFERINPGIDGEPQTAFLMGAASDTLPYVDCHAACLLALVRASEQLDFIDWMAAIDRGLAAFCLETQMVETRKVDSVCVDYLDKYGVRWRTETLWNFKAGICLQLFAALRNSGYPALRAIWAKHRARLEIFEGVLRARLEGSIRRHEDGLEILTSQYSSETNSETQPWAALGLIGDARGRNHHPAEGGAFAP